MEKLYEILIRFHPDGKIGAAAYFYNSDGVTPNPSPLPLHSNDFPALSKKTLADLLDEHIDTLTQASANTEKVLMAEQNAEELRELRSAAHIARFGEPIALSIDPTDDADAIAAKVADAQKILTKRTKAMLASPVT